MNDPGSRVAAVVIGRNEGERLERCLKSVLVHIPRIVYVDSGSTDASVDTARQLGVNVVTLADSERFSASRARNSGYAKVRAQWPTVEFVQFLDGDMELLDEWLEQAAEAFDSQHAIAAVCGGRREKYPSSSVYNRICDVEWRVVAATPEVNFGGDVVIRCRAFDEVGGYDEGVLAAEDDELALRLRRGGHEVVRLDVPAAMHDADMRTFGEWWRRAARCGHAYAQVGTIHGQGDERKFVRPLRRAFVAGGILPLVLVAAAVPTRGRSLVGFALYPVDAMRIAVGTRRQGYSWADSVAWGASCAFGAFPQVVGALRFLSRNRPRGPRMRSVTQP
jgi:glycosyltransferase involved in cell wall biosynthesis